MSKPRIGDGSGACSPPGGDVMRRRFVGDGSDNDVIDNDMVEVRMIFIFYFLFFC